MDDIKQLYNDNILNRNRYLDIITSLFNTTNKHLSIALDGQWGSGKTVFLKEILYISNNEIEKCSDNIKKFNDDYLVIYLDAWEYDKYNDPLITILYAMANSTMEHIDNNKVEKNEFIKTMNTFFKVLGKTTYQFALEREKYLKLLINNIKEEKNDKEENELSQFSSIISINQQIDDINNYISKLLQLTQKSKMIIIIDELDRCNPNYAVNLLEITKHIFTSDDCHLIFGINKLELSKCINHYYGNINSTEYLDKIFDMTFSLPNIEGPQLKEYFEFKSQQINVESKQISLLNGYSPIIINLYQQFNLSLREINRTISIFNNINGTYIANELTTWGDSNYKLYIELFIYLYILKIKQYDIFNTIKNNISQGIKILIDNIHDIDIPYKDHLINKLQETKDNYDKQNHSECVEDYKTIISLVDFLK